MQQLLDLDAGENVDVVQRLVPDVQMGGLAQASGQQYLFLLSGGVVAHILLELHPLEAQLPQDRKEQALIETVPGGVVPQPAPQTGGVLRHVGDDQPAGCLQSAEIGDILPAA